MTIDMQGLIGEMDALISKIKDGSATQGEIEAFAAAAAQLNERAIVLRYKAYESQVFGTPMQQPVQVESHLHLVTEPMETENETAVAEEMATTEAAVETNDPDITFALFEEPEASKEEEESTPDMEGFDLFSMDDDPEEELFVPEIAAEEHASHPEPATEPSQYEFIAPEPEVRQTPATESEPAMERPFAGIEPIVEKETEEPAVQEDRPVMADPQVEFVAPYDEIRPQTQSETETFAEGPIHPLYSRLKTNDDSLAAKLMAVRLESLKGAFGFNERMQIVQELFDGSNDAFSEAIETLDQLASKGEARQKVSNYANRFDWDERSELVMDFVQKVERRYA